MRGRHARQLAQEPAAPRQHARGPRRADPRRERDRRRGRRGEGPRSPHAGPDGDRSGAPRRARSPRRRFAERRLPEPPAGQGAAVTRSWTAWAVRWLAWGLLALAVSAATGANAQGRGRRARPPSPPQNEPKAGGPDDDQAHAPLLRTQPPIAPPADPLAGSPETRERTGTGWAGRPPAPERP